MHPQITVGCAVVSLALLSTTITATQHRLCMGVMDQDQALVLAVEASPYFRHTVYL